MEIKYCPNCDRRVLPRTDGSCPSCHAAFNDDCSGSNAPEPSRFSHTPRTKSRHATLVIIGALILVASVIFLVIPKHPEDGKSIHVDNASLVIVQASGLNRFYGQTAMSLQGNSIGGAEQPPGSSAVFIVRDFDGLGDHVLNQMKRDGVKTVSYTHLTLPTTERV